MSANDGTPYGLVLRSEAKPRVWKDAPEGGTGKKLTGCVLRGGFAAPQDEAVGMKYAELQNQDIRREGALRRLASLRSKVNDRYLRIGAVRCVVFV